MKKVNFVKSSNINMMIILFVHFTLMTNAAFSQDSILIKGTDDINFKIICVDSKGTFIDNGAIICRDVKIAGNGVNAFFRLVKLDERTGEFNSNFVKGRFYKNKAEVVCTKLKIVKYNPNGWIYYSANKVDSIDSQIILKGNAKLFTLNNDQYIDADEIIIDIVKHDLDYMKDK
jgi:hypothetical protein